MFNKKFYIMEIKNEIEVWKSLDFLGYPDYEVSNWGRVKSVARTIIRKNGRKQIYYERILKPGKNTLKYLHVSLYKNSKRKHFLIHRLVCLAFLENPNNYPCVNHKDENPSNNHISNLEWCTHEYNMNYGTKLQRQSEKMKGKFIGENHPMYGKHHSEETKQKISQTSKGKHHSEEHIQKISQANKIPILQFTKDMVFIREWNSATDIEKELHIHQGNICQCCKGNRKTCGGYIWRYKE